METLKEWFSFVSNYFTSSQKLELISLAADGRDGKNHVSSVRWEKSQKMEYGMFILQAEIT